MSMPSKILRCDACGKEANTCMLHQSFRYWYKDTEVFLPRTLGFCLDCNNFAPIEYFGTRIEETNQKLEAHSTRVTRFVRRVLSSNPRPWLRKVLAYCFSELCENVYFLELAETRRGDERCLCCLSRNIIKFEGNINLPYDISGVYVGKAATGFIHPGCGGEFWVENSPWRFNLARHPQYFLVDDLKISRVAEQ
jgi:hypothetical protein